MISRNPDPEDLKQREQIRRMNRPRANAPAGAVPSPHAMMAAKVVDNSGDCLEVDVQAVSGEPGSESYADTSPKLTRDVVVIGGAPADFAVGDTILIWRRGAYYFTQRAYVGEDTSIGFDDNGQLETKGITNTINLGTVSTLTVTKGLITGFS